MKIKMFTSALVLTSLMAACQSGQPAKSAQLAAPAPSSTPVPRHLYIDVHHLAAGKVKFADVADAHAKDLATESKYGVQFLKYWVDEKAGNVYCLSSSPDTASIRKTHGEAHGLLPDEVYEVTGGQADAPQDGRQYYLDIHQFGPGKVTAADVAGAHEKDLATQSKYGVHFINYWVDEQKGTVMCLSQAKDSAAVVNTHREAHGLLPDHIYQVKPGE